MPRPRSDLRPRIIAAARARFLEDGVDGASLRAIARDADTNIGMIYYYFPSKDELFLGVVEDVYARLLDDFAAILTPEGPVRDKLEGISTRVGTMSSEELAVVRIMIREALGESPRLSRIVERFQRGHIPMVVGAVAQGMAGGELTTRQPLPVLLIGMVSGIMFPQLIRRLVVERLPDVAAVLPDAATLARANLELVLGGAAGERPTHGGDDEGGA